MAESFAAWPWPNGALVILLVHQYGHMLRDPTVGYMGSHVSRCPAS